jgi:hypothetical protein
MTSAAMTSTQSRTHELINRETRSRCLDLFKSYGLDLVEVAPRAAPATPLLYCGVIGYSGKGIRGSLALAGSAAVLGASNPVTTQPSREWAGELANQLMGHVKSRLLAYEVEVYLSTPTVLRGEQLSIRSHGELPPTLFTDAAGKGDLVGVWIDLETDPGLKVADQEVAAHAGLPGGEALLF